MIYLADTNFLIICWRNAKQPERLLSLRPYLESEIRLAWIVKAEFLRGALLANHDLAEVNQFLDRHKTVWPDEPTLNIYAQIYARLLRANQMIGPHDLWIAATALRHKLPILTRNISEFQRVPELQLATYSL